MRQGYKRRFFIECHRIDRLTTWSGTFFTIKNERLNSRVKYILRNSGKVWREVKGRAKLFPSFQWIILLKFVECSISQRRRFFSSASLETVRARKCINFSETIFKLDEEKSCTKSSIFFAFESFFLPWERCWREQNIDLEFRTENVQWRLRSLISVLEQTKVLWIIDISRVGECQKY